MCNHLCYSRDKIRRKKPSWLDFDQTRKLTHNSIKKPISCPISVGSLFCYITQWQKDINDWKNAIHTSKLKMFLSISRYLNFLIYWHCNSPRIYVFFKLHYKVQCGKKLVKYPMEFCVNCLLCLKIFFTFFNS